jgi:hypothetical protein
MLSRKDTAVNDVPCGNRLTMANSFRLCLLNQQIRNFLDSVSQKKLENIDKVESTSDN